MQYIVKRGTVGKLVKIEPNADATVVEWTTRKDLAFTDCLINPTVVKTMVLNANKKPLAVRMAEDGYALFGGESGGDREARYVLAIPYSQIKIIE